MAELSEKLDKLIMAIGGPGHEAIAREIREAGGPTISGAYLWQLRTGARGNPTFQHLQALSAYFSGKLGMPVTLNYFEPRTALDQPWRDAQDADRVAVLERQLAEEKELSSRLADHGVRHFASRYGSMNPDLQRKILAIADTLAEAEEPMQSDRSAGEQPQ